MSKKTKRELENENSRLTQENHVIKNALDIAVEFEHYMAQTLCSDSLSQEAIKARARVVTGMLREGDIRNSNISKELIELKKLYRKEVYNHSIDTERGEQLERELSDMRIKLCKTLVPHGDS